MSGIENIVLQGGALKVISSLGALHTIYEDESIQPKRFAGASAGALVAFLLCTKMTPIEIYRFLSTTNLSKTLFDAWYRVPFNLFHRFGLHSAIKFETFLKDLIVEKGYPAELNFNELYQLTGNELVVAGACLNKRETHYFHRQSTPLMPVWKALRISISLPLILTPVSYNNHLYVDGGLIDPLPMHLFSSSRIPWTCTTLDTSLPIQDTTLGIILLESTMKRDATLYYGYDAITNLLQFASSLYEMHYTQLERNLSVPDFWKHVISISMPDKYSFIELSLSQEEYEELFELGRAAARAYKDVT